MVRNLCGQKSGRITAWNRSTEVKKIVFILEWVFLILCLHTVTSSLSLSHALDLSLIKPLPLKIIEVSFSENIIFSVSLASSFCLLNIKNPPKVLSSVLCFNHLYKSEKWQNYITVSFISSRSVFTIDKPKSPLGCLMFVSQTHP